MKSGQKTTTSLRSQSLLAATFAVCALLAFAAITFIQEAMADRLARELAHDVRLVRAAGVVDMMHDALRADTLAAQLAGVSAAEEEKTRIRADVKTNGERLDTHLQTVRALGATLLGKSGDAALVKAGQYRSAATQLVDTALADPMAAKRLQPAFDAAFDELEKELEAVSTTIEQAASARADAIAPMHRIMLTAACAGMALAMLAFWWVGRVVRLLLQSISRALQIAQQVAQGDLRTPVETQTGHEGAQLISALAQMRVNLLGIVEAVRSGSDEVASASEQMTRANDELATRTAGQIGAIGATTASINALSRSVHQTADSAQAANDLAQAASNAAVEGGTVVDTVAATMDEIQAGSQRIADIIGKVDTIAAQTNILALNAAVEAARAGESGRGFAVIAAEVRQLAQHSAGAAREIKSLIDSSVDRIEQGKGLADRASASMQDVVLSIGRVSGLIVDISTAGAGQRTEVDNVRESIAGIQQCGELNAGVVHENALAAHQMQHQSHALVRVVSAFRTSQPADSRSAGPARPEPDSTRRPPKKPLSTGRHPLS